MTADAPDTGPGSPRIDGPGEAMSFADRCALIGQALNEASCGRTWIVHAVAPHLVDIAPQLTEETTDEPT
jgi:hypothetical protein